MLRHSVELDPNDAEAWAAIASTTFMQQAGGLITLQDAQSVGVEAAHCAVTSDPHNPFVLASAAATLSILGSNMDQAVELAERALWLNSTSAQVLAFGSFAYNFSGDFDQALPLTEAARRLSPLDPRGFVVLNQITTAHFFSRRFDEAIRWATRATQEHPGFPPPHRFLAASLALAGRLGEARDAVARLLQVQPNSSLSRSRQNNHRHKWMTEMFADGLRLAGLPE